MREILEICDDSKWVTSHDILMTSSLTKTYIMSSCCFHRSVFRRQPTWRHRWLYPTTCLCTTTQNTVVEREEWIRATLVRYFYSPLLSSPASELLNTSPLRRLSVWNRIDNNTRGNHQLSWLLLMALYCTNLLLIWLAAVISVDRLSSANYALTN